MEIQDVAVAAEIALAHVANIERGRIAVLPQYMAMRLARVLGVSVPVLLGAEPLPLPSQADAIRANGEGETSTQEAVRAEQQPKEQSK
jgi:plasmid maintenance system antidote protein VapI